MTTGLRGGMTGCVARYDVDQVTIWGLSAISNVSVRSGSLRLSPDGYGPAG